MILDNKTRQVRRLRTMRRVFRIRTIKRSKFRIAMSRRKAFKAYLAISSKYGI